MIIAAQKQHPTNDKYKYINHYFIPAMWPSIMPAMTEYIAYQLQLIGKAALTITTAANPDLACMSAIFNSYPRILSADYSLNAPATKFRQFLADNRRLTDIPRGAVGQAFLLTYLNSTMFRLGKECSDNPLVPATMAALAGMPISQAVVRRSLQRINPRKPLSITANRMPAAIMAATLEVIRELCYLTVGFDSEQHARHLTANPYLQIMLVGGLSGLAGFLTGFINTAAYIMYGAAYGMNIRQVLNGPNPVKSMVLSYSARGLGLGLTFMAYSTLLRLAPLFPYLNYSETQKRRLPQRNVSNLARKQATLPPISNFLDTQIFKRFASLNIRQTTLRAALYARPLIQSSGGIFILMLLLRQPSSYQNCFARNPVITGLLATASHLTPIPQIKPANNPLLMWPLTRANYYSNRNAQTKPSLSPLFQATLNCNHLSPLQAARLSAKTPPRLPLPQIKFGVFATLPQTKPAKKLCPDFRHLAALKNPVYG